MKKTISKSMAWLLSVVMAFGVLMFTPIENAEAYTSHSRDEAVAWAKSKIGSKIDVDGAYGAQCVDLIMAYYQYLGVSRVSGNGCDYSHNSLPSGWTRIQNTASFVPNPGDIVVWTDEGWKNGHVAIFLSGNTSNFTSIDQNWPQGSEVKEVYHSSYKYVWGVIRPDFTSNPDPAPNTFHDLSKVDRGTNFYSMIIRNENWAHISDENSDARVNNNGNIVWYFSKTSDGGYTIKNVATGKYLDVNGAGDSNNVNVQTWEYNGSAAQIWYIYGPWSGEYVLKPKCTGDRVLNVYKPTGEAFIYTFDPNDKDMRFALWDDIKTYTVSYNMNGGNGSIGNQTKVQYSPLTLSSTRPTRSGYTFVGWNTNKNATTAQYQPGGRYTDNNGATLYAIWKANTYTIAYNANGGSGSMNSSSIYYGQTLTLPECKFTKTGYNCVGYNVRRNSDNKWYTNEKGWITEQEINNTKSNKKVYSIKGSYGFDSSWTGGASSNDTFTFYPVWKVKTVTVTFYRNQNGSDNTTATQTFTYGASGQSFSNKNWTKNGYTLLGWSFDRNATTASYSVLSGVTDNWIKDNSPSRNLYAVWKRTDENLGTYKYANPNKTTLYARISYNGTNKYLTNLSDNASNDKSYKNIQLKTKNDSLQQVWEFEKLSDGGYKISSVYDGRILDIYNTKTDNGTNIGACGTYYANGGQIWYLIKKDGKYLIQPKVSPDIYLGVANTNDGGNIQVTTSSHLFNIEILKPVGTSTMQVTQEGTSASPTKFTWTAASDATWYNLYIYDGEVWKSNCIYGQKNIKGLEWSVQLKPGKYQAHLSPINIHNWTNSNFVSFTVKENKYTMNYNANGGTGTMNTQTLIFGENFTVPENKFVKTGYDFTCFNMYRSYDNKWYVGDGNGWQTQSDIDKNGYKKKEYRPGDKHPMDIYWTSNYSGDLSFTFYPVWKAKQVTVTFYRNQNSSDNTTATQTFTYGASGQSFSNKNWTKDGYTLLGWSENRNATEKQYSITNGVGSDWINQKSPKVNLYAVWKINAPSEKPIISGLNEIYDVGEDIIITWNKVDRATSYQVEIWRNPGTEAEKIIDTTVTSNSYTLNNVIPGKHSVWIYAINSSGSVKSEKYWCFVPYTIRYDLNGGTGSISPTSKIQFTDCTLISTIPTRNGYDFVGWNTNKDATTAQYQPGDKYSDESDITLYAIWKAVPLVNTSEISATAIKLGGRISITASSTGGTGNYTYAVLYKKASAKNWTTKQDFDTNSIVSIKPAKATDYIVLVKVKDSSGTIVEKSFTVNVFEALKNSSKVVSENIGLGDTITIKASATGGLGEYLYEIFYKKEANEKWTKSQSYSTNNIVSFKPRAATTYDICVKVKDSRDVVVKKYLKVNVTTPENTSTIASTEITLGNKIRITCSATGSSGFYQYAVFYKKTSSKNWTTKQDYSPNSLVTIKPSAKTSYEVCVKVKDNFGNVSKKYFTVTVK